MDTERKAAADNAVKALLQLASPNERALILRDIGDGLAEHQVTSLVLALISACAIGRYRPDAAVLRAMQYDAHMRK